MFTATNNLSQEPLICRDRIHAHANTGVNLFNSGDEDTCTETEKNYIIGYRDKTILALLSYDLLTPK